METNLDNPHPRPVTPPTPLWPNLVPQVQHFGDSCGWTSCAVVTSFLTGRHVTDEDLRPKYGGGALVDCLNKETGPKYYWHDTMNFGHVPASIWPLVEHNLRNGLPSIMGLNGQYSETGRGHVMAVQKVESDVVTFTDSSVGPSGRFLVTTKQAVQDCPLYPGGCFILICQKVAA